MAEELISVILPVYNIEKYLEKCMASLFCQTYSNLEFVIVDDGSAKVCADLCDAMAERDSRVVVYHKENGGLSDARNYGDPIRLKQACINLLKNAMESITGRGKIILKIFVQEKKLLIAVKDNGCGMTSEQLTNVFHPFVTFKEHGTGLGLPIVRKIVTAQGGTVRVSSTPGKGSEFQMYLPLLPVASVYL